MWAEWTYKWGCEVSESNLRLVDKYRDHAATWFPGEDYWQPGSWAVWDVIRNHNCNSDEEYDDPDEFMGVRREDPAADAVLMARDRARGFLVDSDTSEEDDADEADDDVLDEVHHTASGWAAIREIRSHDNDSGDVPEAYVGGAGPAADGIFDRVDGGGHK
jgi:hypothetical protein